MTTKRHPVLVHAKPPTESKTVWVAGISALFFISELVQSALTDQRVVSLIPDRWLKWVGLALSLSMLVLRFRTFAPLTPTLDKVPKVVIKEEENG